MHKGSEWKPKHLKGMQCSTWALDEGEQGETTTRRTNIFLVFQPLVDKSSL